MKTYFDYLHEEQERLLKRMNQPMHELSILNTPEYNGPVNEMRIDYAEWDGDKIHVVGQQNMIINYRYWQAWVNPKWVGVIFDIYPYEYSYIWYPTWYNLKVYPLSYDKFDEYMDKKMEAFRRVREHEI